MTVATALRRTGAGGAPPTYQAITRATGTGTFSTPSGTAAGDVLVAIGQSNNGRSWTAPSGFTRIAYKSGNGYNSMAVAYRVCDGTEAGSYSWPSEPTGNLCCLRYSGSSGVDVYSALNDNRSTICTFPAITTTVANALVLGISCGYTDRTMGAVSTGYTQRENTYNGGPFVEEKALAAAGAETPSAITSAYNWNFGFTMAIKP